ncbi:hypothetical protein QOZ80_6AG0532300 [Eleusine coracana subsp. coracana]|nr:hypothetical protein QOZ80_6AG0532300 [Eleusine coracana subsp. coracana]
MLRTSLAIVTTLLMHHLSLMVVASAANNTTFPNTISSGFSVRLVPNNAIHRHDDGGFQHLLHNLRTNLQPNQPSVANTIEPLQNSHAVIASFGSGHGLRSYHLKVDTAVTAMTWIQCVPCIPYAPQENDIFNFALSPTFRNIPGRSLVCGHPFGTPSGHLCAFRATGPGDMLVTGYLEEDHFTIGTPGRILQNYVFGCSHSTKNFNSEGRYAGVVALGRSSLSLVMQVAARGLTQFSYCLIGGSKTNRHGFLRFGSDIPHNPHYRITRILPALEAYESEYYLSLIGISLGGQKLDRIRPEMFARGKGKIGGCVIDLGTPLTVVVQEAYNIIEEAVWSDLEHQKVERVERPGFGLCFRATNSVKGSFKSLSLHFSEEEAVLVLSPEQLYLMMDGQEGQIACLAMKPGNRTVIGAFQQVDTRFVYDVKESKLSFASESCTQDTVEVVD